MHPQSQKNGKPSSRPGKMFIVKLLSNTADVVFFWMIINIFLYFKGAKYIVIWYENITVMLMSDTREMLFFRQSELGHLIIRQKQNRFDKIFAN